MQTSNQHIQQNRQIIQGLNQTVQELQKVTMSNNQNIQEINQTIQELKNEVMSSK
jgi:uncharacterized coiled-coil DUF342 family protein